MADSAGLSPSLPVWASAVVASNDAAADRYEPKVFQHRIDESKRLVNAREDALALADGKLEKALARVRDLEDRLDRIPVRGIEID